MGVGVGFGVSVSQFGLGHGIGHGLGSGRVNLLFGNGSHLGNRRRHFRTLLKITIWLYNCCKFADMSLAQCVM